MDDCRAKGTIPCELLHYMRRICCVCFSLLFSFFVFSLFQFEALPVSCSSNFDLFTQETDLCAFFLHASIRMRSGLVADKNEIKWNKNNKKSFYTFYIFLYLLMLRLMYYYYCFHSSSSRYFGWARQMQRSNTATHHNHIYSVLFHFILNGGPCRRW